MAIHETEERNGKLRTVMKLEPGERVALCRCMRSAEFPFCDGTHKSIEGSAGPAIVEASNNTNSRCPKFVNAHGSNPPSPRPSPPLSSGGTAHWFGSPCEQGEPQGGSSTAVFCELWLGDRYNTNRVGGVYSCPPP
jgi:CDGSH-type Zn-finger protein